MRIQVQPWFPGESPSSMLRLLKQTFSPTLGLIHLEQFLDLFQNIGVSKVERQLSFVQALYRNLFHSHNCLKRLDFPLS